MKKIKAIVIGLGQSGITLDLDTNRKGIWTHAFAIDKHPKLELCGAVDIDPKKENLLRKIFPSKNKLLFSNDIKDLLDRADPSFVSICTPTKFHLKTVKEVLKKKNINYIFFEKPMGSSSKEASQIISLCKQSNVILGVNYMRRWDRKYLWIKNKIDSKILGNLISINANSSTALYTSASHMIDLLHFFGGNIQKVSGFLQDDYVRLVAGEKDYGAHAFLRFENKITSHLKASSKSPLHYMFELDLLFEDGRILIKNDGENIFLSNFKKGSSSGSEYLGLTEKEIYLKPNERIIDAITDIISCKSGRMHPISSAQNALQVQKVIETIIKSSKNNGNFYKL